MNKIQEFQKYCWTNYKKDIGLPENYNYIYGNPIKVHVPVDVATKGIMIIGAYPTAHFNTFDGIRDVPVEDHLYPFSNENYFDGSSVRAVKSGQELEEYYFSELGISRYQCWITDLVKVFLFKKGHIKKYEQIGYFGQEETRTKFREYGIKSLKYIDEEIKLAKPKVILSLGAEVASIMLGVSEKKAIEIMTEEPIDYYSNGVKYILFALPHPGIIMRKSEKAIKWHRILEMQLNVIKMYI